MYDTVFSAKTRNFDILVDNVLVVDNDTAGTVDVSLGTSNPETSTMGRLYTLDFVADGDETQVAFAIGQTGTEFDPNPILNGVTLATAIPEPASFALCLFGMVVTGLVRRRS